MKRLFCSLLLLMLLNSAAYSQAGIGIGTTTPAASAVLDVSSTTRGLLPPRMTAAQRNAIATPANGLIVFDTDSAALMVRSAGGWRRLTTTATPGGFWQVNGANIFNSNAGNVGIGVNEPLFKLDVSGRVLLRGQGAANTSPGIVFSSLNGQEARAMLAMQNDTVLGLYSDYPNIANAGWPLAVNVVRGRIGINTSQPQAALHVADSNVLFAASAFAPFPPGPVPVSGAGRRMMWYADKAAFRAGFVSGTQWDTDSIGGSSFASGYDSKAKGNFSTAMGFTTTASGIVSTAMGNLTRAMGDGSTAIGSLTQATGNFSTAMGAETIASGEGSTALGYLAIASGDMSVAIGIETGAKAFSGVSLGFSNDISDNPNPKVPASSDRLFQIGNGNGDDLSPLHRSNALTVLRNGNMGLGNVNTPNAPLQFNNLLQNRKLILYENANNDHQYYGFGINSGVLRYQTDASNADHVFYSAASASASNELLRIKGNGNIGIGVAGTNAPLQFANDVRSRKIVLWEGANNDHQFYGFGVNGFTQRYQVPGTGDAHVFFAGASATTSNELFRISGNGNIGVNQPNPGVYGHGGTARALEIWNNSSVGNDVQSHLVLSTSGSGGSMGGITWATTAIGGEQKAAFAGAAYEAGTNNALFQVLLRRNGSLAQRFRVNSDGSAFLQGSLTQNSDETLKKNIEPIANASHLLQQLHGYRYQWKDENADADKQLGLLAQEVQKVLPELVKEGENGKLGVNYNGLIPVLLEALKEQQGTAQQQAKLLSQQGERIRQLEKLLAGLLNGK